MLAIIADPTYLPRVDPGEWEEILTGALAGPLDAGQLTMHVVKKATRKEITGALLPRKPDIVQFIGHGVYRDGAATVALVDPFSGGMWPLDEERFVGLFAGHDDNLGLVSLTTCESATTEDAQGFSGLAPRLQQRGLPAVLAMQYKVKMKTARVVLEEFYGAAAARKPLDFAVQQARNAVSLDFGLDNREFATPVLYSRVEDGRIF
jgi:CHAT domain-containing protein